MLFLKTRPFVKQNNAEFTNVSSFTSLLMCSTHFTPSCRILRFPLPTTKNFFKFVYSEITGESAWPVLFRPPSPATEGHQNFTHFDSGLLISRTFLPRAESSCTLLYLYLVSCTQKNALKSTQFSSLAQCSAEPSNNWGTGPRCLRPLWIYCTGQQHKASLFPCLCSSLFTLCLQLLRHGSYLSFTQVLSFHTSTITSPFLPNADFPFFRPLPSPSRSRGMPVSPPSAVDSHISV